MYRTTSRVFSKTASCKYSHNFCQIVNILDQFLPELNRRFYSQQRDKHTKTLRRYRPTKAIRICTSGEGKTKNTKKRNCNDNSTFNVYKKASRELAKRWENNNDDYVFDMDKTERRAKYGFTENSIRPADNLQGNIVADSDSNEPSLSEIPDSELKRGEYYADVNAYKDSADLTEFEEILNRRKKISAENIEYKPILDQENEEYPRKISSEGMNYNKKVNLEAAVLSSKNIHGKDQSMHEFITSVFEKGSTKFNTTMDSSDSDPIESSEQLYFPNEQNPYRITIINNRTTDSTSNSHVEPFAINVVGAKEISNTEDESTSVMEGKANTIQINVTDSGLGIKLMLSNEDNLSESEDDENQQPKATNMENPFEEKSNELLPVENQQLDSTNKVLLDRNPSHDFVQNVNLNNSDLEMKLNLPSEEEPLELINKDDEFYAMELTKTEQNQQQQPKAIKLNSIQEEPEELFPREYQQLDSIYQRVLENNRRIIVQKESQHQQPGNNVQEIGQSNQHVKQPIKLCQDVYGREFATHPSANKRKPRLVKVFKSELALNKSNNRQSVNPKDSVSQDKRDINNYKRIQSNQNQLNLLEINKKNEKLLIEQKPKITRFKQDIYEINHTDHHVAEKKKDLIFFPIKDYYSSRFKLDSTEKTNNDGSSTTNSNSSVTSNKPTEPTIYGFSSTNTSIALKQEAGQSIAIKGGNFPIPMQKFYEQLENDDTIRISGGTKRMKQRHHNMIYSDSERKNYTSKKEDSDDTTNERNDKNIDESLLQYKERYTIDDPKNKPKVKRVDADEDDDEALVKRELIYIPEENKKKKLFSGFKNIVSFIFTTEEEPKRKEK